ncbi:MAG TPA: MSMEG_0570 family nitrogen starvation response protein [Allocoleopsis sp.]
MPELRFQIQWPDGSQETCYSPSLVIKDYLTPEQEYPLSDFLERSRIALQIASDRVQAKYGMPCSLALGQLQRIETKATEFKQLADSKIRVVRFIE